MYKSDYAGYCKSVRYEVMKKVKPSNMELLSIEEVVLSACE